MSLPTVTIIGTVKFMETKFTQSGKQVTSLTVSCSDKNKDGTYSNLNIKADFWEKSAEFVNNHFRDGEPIVVTGKLITNSWEQDGTKRYEIKFHFPQAGFVPKVQQSNSQQGQPQQQQQYQQPQQVPTTYEQAPQQQGNYQQPQQQQSGYQQPQSR